MSQSPKLYGLLAEYDSAHDIYEACIKVRDAGYEKWDACTPFPVHGLEKAMGLSASRLPWMVLGSAITGASLAIIFMVWVSVFDYPLNIGGKPTWSIPAFIPVMFEITILFGALTAVFGMIWLNGLPSWHHPLFQSVLFEGVTDDKFFIVIESSDPLFDQVRTQKLLMHSGAIKTEVLEA
jgi:Protein of unknown function (DUF3341)